MERNRSRQQSSGGKWLLFLAIMALAAGALTWGVRAILETREQFGAAAAGAGDIGILARQVVASANQLAACSDEKSYTVATRKLRARVRQLETVHWSFFRGNPGFSPRNRFAFEIKQIYLSAPIHAIARVREFLDHANLLLETPYPEFTPANPHLHYLKTAVRGNLIQTVSQTIRAYQKAGEAHLYRTVTLLITAVGTLLLIAFFRYLAWVRRQPALTNYSAGRSGGSVANLLRNLPRKGLYEKETIPLR